MKEFNYLSIDDVVKDERFPFTKGMIRAFMMNRENNGLAKATRKIGKRIYLRDDLLIEWIESYTDLGEKK